MTCISNKSNNCSWIYYKLMMELCAVVKTCQALIPGPFPELLVPTGKVVSLL